MAPKLKRKRKHHKHESRKQDRKGVFIADPKSNKGAVKKQKSQFMCQLKYKTDLPEPHNHMKLMVYPFQKDRLSRYCGSYMDMKRIFDVQPEGLLGVPIDLIDLDRYATHDEEIQMSMEDQRLFLPEVDPSAQTATTDGVSWLRKSVPLGNDQFGRSIGHRSQVEIQQERVEQARRRREERMRKNTREWQIKSIVKSFTDATEILPHPTNNKLTVKEVVPLLPAPKSQQNKYTWIRFTEANEYEPMINAGEMLVRCLDHDHQAVYSKPEGENNYKWKNEVSRQVGEVVEREKAYIMILNDGKAEFCQYERKVICGPRAMDDDLVSNLKERPKEIHLKKKGETRYVGTELGENSEKDDTNENNEVDQDDSNKQPGKSQTSEIPSDSENSMR
mmetsp:Transcript_2737/g.6325  ORF Transcript_2737/g.6325 Transcript_2737/m.6325 type:complete len:390 (+) Transcript_2737:21-1190(+)